MSHHDSRTSVKRALPHNSKKVPIATRRHACRPRAPVGSHIGGRDAWRSAGWGRLAARVAREPVARARLAAARLARPLARGDRGQHVTHAAADEGDARPASQAALALRARVRPGGGLDGCTRGVRLAHLDCRHVGLWGCRRRARPKGAARGSRRAPSTHSHSRRVRADSRCGCHAPSRCRLPLRRRRRGLADRRLLQACSPSCCSPRVSQT